MVRQEKKLTINELCSQVCMNKRTVRYYIQKELVDRPEGVGKGAFYSHSHLEQLLSIRKWKAAGLSLERIQEILTAEKDAYHSDKLVPPPLPKKQGLVEIWSHIYLDDGIEIHIEPKRAGLSPEKARALFRKVLNLYEKIREEES